MAFMAFGDLFLPGLVALLGDALPPGDICIIDLLLGDALLGEDALAGEC